MNMNLLAVVKTPPAVYHGCSTQKKSRKEKFTPVNMTSCGRRSVRKYREINNGEKYIILDISSKLDLLDKRLVTSSKSKDYMIRPGNGLTTSMDLRTKTSNKKQKARFAVTDITDQDFEKLLKKFKNSPFIGYKIKQVHNKPTEAYFFLIKTYY